MPQLPLPELSSSTRHTPGDVERWAATRGLQTLIGTDEVGRGPLAGPVVAAAVALPRDHALDGLDDSKRLSPDTRSRLATEIRAHAAAFAVVELSADAIDRSNIRQASLLAMSIAVEQVVARIGTPDLVLVDGRDTLPCRHPQRAVIGGDGRSTHIAAASILAKVHRDAVMAALAIAFPAYDFEHNKGYGTAAHRAGLAAVGPCALHRRSFRLT